MNVTQTIKFNAVQNEDRPLGSRPGRRAVTKCAGFFVGLASTDSQLNVQVRRDARKTKSRRLLRKKK